MKSPLAEMISSLASTSLIDHASVTPRAKSGDRADMENVLCSSEWWERPQVLMPPRVARAAPPARRGSARLMVRRGELRLCELARRRGCAGYSGPRRQGPGMTWGGVVDDGVLVMGGG